MSVSWENAAYEFANECMKTSWEKWEWNETGSSWGFSLTARAAHLADLIINIVAAPLALIKLLYGVLNALLTCNRHSIPLHSSWHYLTDRVNHFYMSAIGCVLSPALAHTFRDSNFGFYFQAFKGACWTIALVYGLSRKG